MVISLQKLVAVLFESHDGGHTRALLQIQLMIQRRRDGLGVRGGPCLCVPLPELPLRLRLALLDGLFPFRHLGEDPGAQLWVLHGARESEVGVIQLRCDTRA